MSDAAAMNGHVAVPCSLGTRALDDEQRGRGALPPRGQARGGGSSGAGAAREPIAAGSLSAGATRDALASATTATTGAAVTVQLVVDEHWPGAHGSPQSLPAPEPPHGDGDIGATSVRAVCAAVSAVARAGEGALIAPMSCARIPRFPPPCMPHSVPLPSSVSCRRRMLKSAAKRRRVSVIRKVRAGLPDCLST